MLDLSELATATGGGAAIDLTPDAEFEGVLVSVGEWREVTTKFGVKIKSPFNLEIDGEDRTLWVPKGSRLATVIGEAFKAAGLGQMETGGRLKVRRVADVPTKSGNVMHDFKAKYTPAVKVAADVNLDDF